MVAPGRKGSRMTAEASTIVDNPLLIAAELRRRYPTVHALIADCVEELRVFSSLVLSTGSQHRAGVLIANQCFNDFIDLCFDLLSCRGRSALREARAIFEHHVNLLDVETN